jgi:hypothetical protein
MVMKRQSTGDDISRSQPARQPRPAHTIGAHPGGRDPPTSRGHTRAWKLPGAIQLTPTQPCHFLSQWHTRAWKLSWHWGAQSPATLVRDRHTIRRVPLRRPHYLYETRITPPALPQTQSVPRQTILAVCAPVVAYHRQRSNSVLQSCSASG